MTRKDYRLIADTIKSCEPNKDLSLRFFTYKLADKLWQDNQRFMYDRFYLACGLDKEQYQDQE
jgi:hypothetical protein